MTDHTATPVLTEKLTDVEARLVYHAKVQADRALQDELALVIAAHGYDPHDGRKYDIKAEQGHLILEVS